MQKWVISMNNETLEYELLALIINYPELLERNILKKEYFYGQDQILFKIIFKVLSSIKQQIALKDGLEISPNKN